MKSLTEQAAQVLVEIDAALALADKATAGPWATKLSVGDYNVKVTNIWTNIVGKRIGAITHKNPDHESNATFIASARTVCPKSLRMNKTAIEGMLEILFNAGKSSIDSMFRVACEATLTTLINQWRKDIDNQTV